MRSMAGIAPSPLIALEPISTCDRIIAALKDAFFSGQFKPGEALVERRLAQQLKVGTPPVREALVILQEQGFVKRVANKATYVTQYTPQEAREAYELRVEMETIAFRWAKPHATEASLAALTAQADRLVEAGAQGESRLFHAEDLKFHKACWELSGNRYLVETLERHMAPLAAFVILASDVQPTAEMAREHYALIDALRNLEEPDFSATVHRTLAGFADHWPTAVAKTAQDPQPPAANRD